MDESSERILAAVDLGSNSFHMIVARIDQTGTLSVIDRLRETVRLGGGLQSDGSLSKKVMQRALDCLDRFGQRVRDLPAEDVRIVGTNTLRQATNAEDFIDLAQTSLNHPIEIISGMEEARLIYLGVAHHATGKTEKRLVVDIGGGSTELIVGQGMQPLARESLGMGCVSTSLSYFADGDITEQRMLHAIMEARLAIYPVADQFFVRQWQDSMGCSGTIRAIRDCVQAEGWCESGISLKALYQLRDYLIKVGHIEQLDLKKLKEDRIPVFAGGVCVLIGVFEALKIDAISVSDQALREGLLYDLIGRVTKRDIRYDTVKSTQLRWSVDVEHAGRVATTAAKLFQQVRSAWNLRKNDARLLKWAVELHEIGLQISHGSYHKHSAYLLKHADLPGFSRSEQAILAALVRNHRRKLSNSTLKSIPKSERQTVKYLTMLLRIAILLHRSRSEHFSQALEIAVDKENVILFFDKQWLEQQALTCADLEHETDYLQEIDIALDVKTI